MRVLIFNTLYFPNSIGGAEKSVQSLAENLLKQGVKVTVVTSTSKSDYIDEINGVKVYYINNRNLYWGFDQESASALKKIVWHSIDTYNFRLENKITKILQKEKPKIVHTNNLSGLSVVVWKVAQKNRIKIIHTIRDYYLVCPNATMYKDNKNCFNQCLLCKKFSLPKKKTSCLVDSVVGISDYVLQKHIQLGYFENTISREVIGNDIRVVETIKRDVDESSIVFGFIGQLNESKGIIQLLKTFEKLEHINNWKLIIAGRGNGSFDDLLKKKYKSNRVEFVGVVDSEFFYKSIDVLIVPSLWQEPFGRVVIEGVLHGKYVLASKRGGIKELLIEDDLFEPESDELIVKIMEILRTKVVPEQRNKFTEKVASRYVSLYNKMLEN
ncbi:MAG: glycosyltransferase family 4 protein [Flavobacterium nitrogenifigens]|uniref:Glycosyltransferase involved in cell wall bisynthesis n=1 Tax=Flavobacterium nitrogenifigens TaxID=1617283 RepID=A0A521DJB6_9FLAO|nr:glycosyltransferase family 4 protein [Flavobacterium nitrogenifigens]KAF2330060.1 glycosyltransferase family 4 protein [Flavobacterium nitrogenifigens]MDQ8012238.1 glycosyltransferase family 4 protein [Flavobacterium nitrogenifigens]SMO71698.1 Glycosyltransferase involved in cell wall bisynthesis [Flavobacterium nitrogenifigens]